MDIDDDDMPTVGMLLADYLAKRVGDFSQARDVAITNGVMLHASAALFASAMAEILKANPPEIGEQVMASWITRIRARAEQEARNRSDESAGHNTGQARRLRS